MAEKSIEGCFQSTLSGEVILSINVLPGSTRQGIVGFEKWQGDLRIALTAKAEKGKANSALLHVLSKLFRVPKRFISIVSGHKSRNKKVKVSNTDINTLKKIIIQLLEEE
tara:strand:- start:295 stop:624 length:330 start_codon:yes stop_codon:yes gene_type:complete